MQVLNGAFWIMSSSLKDYCDVNSLFNLDEHNLRTKLLKKLLQVGSHNTDVMKFL